MGLKDSVLSRWKQEFIERSPQLFEQGAVQQDDREERIAELERMVGRLATEIEMSKKSIQVLELEVTQKREVAKAMTTAGYPITMVCDLLELPRSTYYYQPVQVDETELQTAIEDLAGQFPTYGTRRITHQFHGSTTNNDLYKYFPEKSKKISGERC